jgi:hypothetical protein
MSFMTATRPQPLSERFANIISVMLGMLRAHGWRALFALPEVIRAARVIRQLRDELIAMMKAFEAGTLSPPPAPASWTEPQDGQAAPAQSPAIPRPAARPRSAARDRQPLAELPPPPAAEAAPDRPRAAKCAHPAPALPRPPRRAPNPFAVLRLPTGIFASGRST